MEIFNAFYRYESEEYIGSSFTLDGAIKLIKEHWRYQPYEDGDSDNPRWVVNKDFNYPILIRFKNPEYGYYFEIEQYEVER